MTNAQPSGLNSAPLPRLAVSQVDHLAGDMKAVSFIVVFVVFATLGGAAGCRGKTSAPGLSLTTVEKTHDGRISFEEKGDEIFVFVTDRFSDGHILQLDYQGHTNQQALDILRRKQIELEKANR